MLDRMICVWASRSCCGVRPFTVACIVVCVVAFGEGQGGRRDLGFQCIRIHLRIQNTHPRTLVPQKMNAGVSTSPWGVRSLPQRAGPPAGSLCLFVFVVGFGEV